MNNDKLMTEVLGFSSLGVERFSNFFKKHHKIEWDDLNQTACFNEVFYSVLARWNGECASYELSALESKDGCPHVIEFTKGDLIVKDSTDD